MSINIFWKLYSENIKTLLEIQKRRQKENGEKQ